MGEAERAVARGEAEDRNFSLTAITIAGAITELVHHWSLQRDTDAFERVVADVVALAESRVITRR